MASVSGGAVRPRSSPPRSPASQPAALAPALSLLLAGLVVLAARACPARADAPQESGRLDPSSREAGWAAALAPAAVDSGLIAGWADTILVEADRRPGSPYPGGPVTVTVVPLEERTGGADLGELLARTAGLQMRRYGGLGAYVLPSIRGSTGAQVAVMVDGMPLAAAADGAVDLSDLPLERFAAAEVHRGGVPAGFGGGSGLGAINLLSRAGASSHLRLFAGSYGDAGGRWLGSWRPGGPSGRPGAGGGGAGQSGATLLLHGRRADNRYDYLDDRQTFADPSDDLIATRRNAGFAEWGGWLSGRGRAAGLRTGLALGYYRRDGGRPGSLAYPSPHAAARAQRLDGHLSLAAADDAVRLDLTAARQRDRLHDDLAEVGVDPRGTTHGGGDELGGRLALSGGPRPGAVVGLRATVGTDWRRQWIAWSLARTGGGQIEQPLRTRTAVTAFASAQVDLFGPRLVLMPSARWQRLADDLPPLNSLGLPVESAAAGRVGRAWSPAAAIGWEALPARLFLEAHASRTVRPPSLTELRGDLGTVLGRLDLRPERLRAWDAGVRWRSRARTCDLRLAWFETRAEDAIVFWPVSGGWNQPRNLGAARSHGLEAEAAGTVGGGAAWRLDLTWQDARDRGGEAAYHGRRLPHLPAFEGSARLDVPWRSWRAGAAAGLLGATYRDRYNSRQNRLPARATFDLALSRSWRRGGSRVTATAELINLTDRQLADVLQYPLPGRSVRFSLHLE